MIVERDGKILTNQNTILRSLSGSNLTSRSMKIRKTAT